MKFFVFMACLMLLSGCFMGFNYGAETMQESGLNEDVLLDYGYKLSVYSPESDSTTVGIGIIIPVYFPCNKKSGVSKVIALVYNPNGDSAELPEKRAEMLTRELGKTAKITFEVNGKIFTRTAEMNEKHIGLYSASFPVVCDSWESADIVIEDIYIRGKRQKSFRFKMKKSTEFGFGPVNG